MVGSGADTRLGFEVVTDDVGQPAAVQSERFVVAQHRIVKENHSTGAGVVLYAPGDRVAWDVAVKLGIASEDPETWLV